MAKYTRTEEKPLSEVIGSRRGFYQARITEAFDKVYGSEDFGYIEQFEQAVSALSARAIQGNLEGTLEQKVRAVSKARARGRVSKVDRRPRLTSHQYTKARDEGLTNEQIKERFRMDSSYQIGGFAKWYTKRKAEDKKAR